MVSRVCLQLLLLLLLLSQWAVLTSCRCSSFFPGDWPSIGRLFVTLVDSRDVRCQDLDLEEFEMAAIEMLRGVGLSPPLACMTRRANVGDKAAVLE